MTQDSDTDVVCEKRGSCGHIWLNRPQALNALTLGMVRGISKALDAWESDPSVTRVVIEGAGGKAFCAGGDIRLLYEQGRAGDHAAQRLFWKEEYILNARIKRYPKPYIALIDGIVMGGGVGVSLLGSHRIASEKFLFAMPEVGIGFFPDVGATYFLPRLPGKAGTYLAMTGARIRAEDGVALGLAQAFVSSRDMADLAGALTEGDDVDATIGHFSSMPAESPLAPDRATIDACFAGRDVAEVLGRLANDPSDFAQATLKTIKTKSPTSVAVAFRQMQIGGGMSIEEAMIQEYRIVSRICRGHDFYEGVRATIIDKDLAPHWRPAASQEVNPADIDAIFAPLDDEDLCFAAPLSSVGAASPF